MNTKTARAPRSNRIRSGVCAPDTPQNQPVTLWSFVDEFEVVCPFCSGRANVVPSPAERRARLSCLQCGKSRGRPPLRPGILNSRNALKWPKNHYAIGDAADPYFHLPLWLQTPCAGNVLWAFNHRHLEFLRTYVAALERDRFTCGGLSRNSLLTSRLPRWMKLAKHRTDVLSAIDKIQRGSHR